MISMVKMIVVGKRIVIFGNYFFFDFFKKELWLNENYKFFVFDNISFVEKKIFYFLSEY